MSLSKITMIGLETALAYRNESLFDLMNLPEGIDKENVTDNIMVEGGEFEVVYADPDFFKNCVGVWSKKHYRTFDKWIKALNIEYSPLENYDRMEEWCDTSAENSNKVNTGTLSDSSTGSVHYISSDSEEENIEGSVNTSNDSSTTAENTTENTVSAFDSSSYQPENKSDVDSSESVSTTEESTNNTDRSLSHDRTDDTTTTNSTTGSTSNNENYSQNNTGNHTGRVHGNIGTLTSQTMLESELNIAKFNIVQQITDLFLQEFCIMIYS